MFSPFVLLNSIVQAAAQCSHATLGAYKKAQRKDVAGLKRWEHHGQAKVCVKVESEKELYERLPLSSLTRLILAARSDQACTGFSPHFLLPPHANKKLYRDAIKAKAKAKGILTHVVMDAGRTQIASGTRTVLALGPAPKPDIDAVAGHLKLY